MHHIEILYHDSGCFDLYNYICFLFPFIEVFIFMLYKESTKFWWHENYLINNSICTHHEDTEMHSMKVIRDAAGGGQLPPFFPGKAKILKTFFYDCYMKSPLRWQDHPFCQGYSRVTHWGLCCSVWPFTVTASICHLICVSPIWMTSQLGAPVLMSYRTWQW